MRAGCEEQGERDEEWKEWSAGADLRRCCLDDLSEGGQEEEGGERAMHACRTPTGQCT